MGTIISYFSSLQQGCYISYQVNTDLYNPVMFVVLKYSNYNCSITKISDTSKASSGKYIETSVVKDAVKLSFTSGGVLSFIKIKNKVK